MTDSNNNNNTDNTKTIDRIRKLLALSKSANEHEAAAAAARAAELMTAHQLSVAMLAEIDNEPVDAHRVETSRQRISWKGRLAVSAAYANGCRCYWGHATIDEVHHRTLNFVGRKDDVDTASYLYRYLCAEVSRLADKTWKSRKAIVVPHHMESARSWKNAFRVSAASMIASRLEQSRDASMSAARSDANDATAQALQRIAHNDQAIATFMENLSLRRSPATRVSSASGYHAGACAGQTIDLGGNKPRLAAAPLRLTGRRDS